MKRVIIILAAVLIISGCVQTQTDEKAEAPSKLSRTETSTLSGYVTDSNGNGIGDAFVALAGGGKVFNTTTENDGSFLFQNIPSGRYAVLTVYSKLHGMKNINDFVLPEGERRINITLP